MLSSNSSSCCNHNPNYTPFSENDITSQNPNFLFGLIPNSPNIYFDDFQVHYLNFLDHTILSAPPAAPVPAAATPSKKDRHSKINTARGPRDRRMRLSLDIARRFFDLQDLLGFDKASKTVDWLLRSSSPAIRELAKGRAGSALSESCTSEEAVTSVGKGRRGRRGKGRVVQQQKRATVARESRRKARERARERTSQKRRLMRESDDVRAYNSDEARGTTQGEGFSPWNSFPLNETDNAAFFHQIDELQFNGKPWEDYSFNMSV